MNVKVIKIEIRRMYSMILFLILLIIIGALLFMVAPYIFYMFIIICGIGLMLEYWYVGVAVILVGIVFYLVKNHCKKP